MKKAVEITRDFRISDQAMIDDGNTTSTLFSGDKADFIAFDKQTFDDPFLANWQAAITASENADTDEQYLDQQTGKTNAVAKDMDACREKYGKTKYFVLKAFPDDTAIQNEFGFNDYLSIRNSQTGLRKFMTTMNKVANKYKTQLNAVGFDQPAIDEILTLGQSLEDGDTDQEVFKKSRPVATQTRRSTHNATWAFRKQVADAAKIIYATNFAKYQQYLLPPSETSAEDTSIKGTVTDEDTNNPIPEATWTIGSLGLTGTSDEFGVYAIGIIPDGDYSIEFKADNYTAKTFSATVSAGTLVSLQVKLKHV